jgi:mannose-6-phosphate isomerase-like protein (cupin superfamily)
MRFIARPALAAFGAACIVLGASCLSLARVEAADTDVRPPLVHVSAAEVKLNPATGNLVSAPLYRTSLGTVQAIQVGNLPTHTHDTADEMFYVTDGSAQITVGDTSTSMKAGDMMIVPKGVRHSIKSDSGLLKAVLITLPPRAADDVHFVK